MAKETVAIRLSRSVGGRTKLEYACRLEVGSGANKKVNRAFVEKRLQEVADTSIYFQRLVGLNDGYTVEDGQALGHDMLWKAKTGSQRAERLQREVMCESKVLVEMEKEFPWLKKMLTGAVLGQLQLNRAVGGTKLICLSDAEAIRIGKNMNPALKSKKLVKAGVDAWRVQNLAVKELMERFEWFEPMAVVLGKGIVKTAAWGLLWRVTIGGE